MQRFCPLCDRSFLEGEAVLRCEGCGVMHHPGCWVTNGGCATQSTHKSTPIAQAYTSAPRPAAAETPHPGEGVRVAAMPAAQPTAASTPPVGAAPAEPHPEPVIGAAPYPVIGEAPPRFVHRTVPFEATTTPPVPPRRYVPPTGEVPGSTRPLPKIYGGHPLTRYWYVPVAAGLAVGVAFFVIWFASLFGGGSDTTKDQPGVGVTVTSSQPGGAAQTAAPGSSATAAPTAAATNGKFKTGDILVVTGTGDCLNVRSAPGTGNTIVVCLNDAEEVTVTGGPQTASDLEWWKVKSALGEGWAAESYLVKK